MSKSKEKRRRPYIGIVCSLLIGAVCGVLMVKYLDSLFEADKTFGEFLLAFAVLFIEIYAALFLQILIHEAGHLLFGLLTGYRYSSFRIGSFMWVKENGKLRFRTLSLVGTGGQCLMVPPEMTDGKIPFVLYNLGGSLTNLLSGAAFLGLYLPCRGIPFLSAWLMTAAVLGFAYALFNGIPMRLGTVDNDGYNALSLGKKPEALRSFWLQMKINDQTTKGIRLKDMPEEWFFLPSPEDMKNSMTAAIGVFVCNRLMDAHEFDKADSLMEELLQTDTAMVGLHRGLIICDRIYCELIGENRQDQLDGLLNKQQVTFMKSMKNFPSVLRTEYAYALLAEKDTAKADKIRVQFDKRARSYPYASDLESERELMTIADRAAEYSSVS